LTPNVYCETNVYCVCESAFYVPTACFSVDLLVHSSKTYLFDCADVLFQHAGVQTLDLSELLTHSINAKRTEEDLSSTRNHRTRALHTYNNVFNIHS